MLRHRIVREDRSAVILGSGVDLTQFPYTEERTAAKPVVLFSSRLLKDSGQADKAKEMQNRVMGSLSYEAALNIVSEYVETELSSKTKVPAKRDRGDAR